MTTTNNNEAADHQLQENDWLTKNGVVRLATIPQDLPSLSTNHYTSQAEDEIWGCTWSVWLRIATAATSPTAVVDRPNPPPMTEGTAIKSNLSEDRRRREYQQPQTIQHKQQFLTSLLKIFPLIFTHIKTR